MLMMPKHAVYVGCSLRFETVYITLGKLRIHDLLVFCSLNFVISLYTSFRFSFKLMSGEDIQFKRLVSSCAIAYPLGGEDILVSWFGFSSVDITLLSTGLSCFFSW